MIAVSRQRYLPTLVNTMVLFKNDRYFYLHRDVYDQAVVLTDKYDQTMEEWSDRIGGSRENERTVRWFYEQAPKPLHILAPCLQLIDGRIEQDIELVCGVLHIITSMIHVKQYIAKPEEIRKSVSFSLTIRDEYEMAWESFFQSAIPYDQRGQLLQSQAVFDAQTQASSRPALLDTVPLYPVGAAPSDAKAERAQATFGPTEEEKKATLQLLMK